MWIILLDIIEIIFFENVNIMFIFEFIDSIDKIVGKKLLEFYSKFEKKIYFMMWEVLSDKSVFLW